MSNQIYPLALEGILRAEIDYDTAVIKAAVCRTVTFNAAHKFVSDVTGSGGSLVSSVVLSGKDAVSGAASCTNPVWSGVAAGAQLTQVLIYQASAVTAGADVAPSAQRLILFVDTGENWPITPNGQPITMAVAATVNKLFRIGA